MGLTQEHRAGGVDSTVQPAGVIVTVTAGK